MRLTKANIDHKAKKIAIALISGPVLSIDAKVDYLTRDLICGMGIKKAKRTRLQIWRELKQMEKNLTVAHNVIRQVGRKLKAEEERLR